MASAASAQSQMVYNFTTMAGLAPGHADGTGAAVGFYFPVSAAVDSAGNLYVADSGNDTIRKMTPSGVVTTLAGTAGIEGSWDATGSAAQFNNPTGIAVDSLGNLYVADSNTSIIRKVTPAGAVTTLAGTAYNTGTADAMGAAAQFNNPGGLAVDSAGNVYVADTRNQTIRKVTPTGTVTTLAGMGGQPGSADGTGSAARFNQPNAVAVDSAGNVYVTDGGNDTIRVVTPGGVVTTLAGVAGQWGDADGTGSAATFGDPRGITIDGAGNLYVATANSDTIREITPAGVVTTIAGAVGQPGSADGTGSAARFNFPGGVAADHAGDVFVVDTDNDTIREVAPGGVVTTLAGTPGQFGVADGTGSAARFNAPQGVAVDSARNVYVADSHNSTIREITPAGIVTTLAGVPGQFGNTDGIGSAARFNDPQDLALDSTGNLYVADRYNYTIRKITPAGLVTTFAGTPGQAGSADGTGSAAQFNFPQSVAVDGTGNVFVADCDNQTIRKITPAGVVTTLAGTAGQGGYADATGGAAKFAEPRSVAVDNSGNIYVADTNNQLIRKITQAGVVTTLAGTANQPGSLDGTGSAARFNYPQGVAVDGAGNVYVADTNSNAIREVTPAGVVTTLAGTPGHFGGADGLGNVAQFNYPLGLKLDGSGNIYVADTNSSTIRKGTLTIVLPPAVTSASPGSGAVGDAVTLNGSGFTYATGVAFSGVGASFTVVSDSQITAVVPPGAIAGPGTITITTPFGSFSSGSFTVNAAPTVTAVTPWQKVFAGNSATFTVSAAAATSYQWQESTDAGNTWVNLVDGGVFSGTATSTLTVSSVSSGMSGDLFRALVANALGSTTSAVSALTVEAPPTATGLTWGQFDNPSYLQVLSPKAITSSVKSIAVGGTQTVFLKSDGSLWVTGGNSNGQLGDGTTIGRDTPEQVATGVVQVAAGFYHTMFVKADGTLWGMGANSHGQLGIGTTNDSWVPVQVPGATGVTAVAASQNSTLFITSDGTLWAMGDDSFGELGDGGASERNSPIKVASGVTAIAGGTYFSVSYFVKSDGSLWAVGDNQFGSLGDGTTNNAGSPEQVATGVASVNSNGESTLFLKTDGTLWGMGQNNAGQLGDGTTTARYSPEQVASGVVSYGAGGSASAFVRTDGTLWVMGSNSSGGLGIPAITGNQTTPVQLASGVSNVAAQSWTMYVDSNGILWGTGYNTDGELGDGQSPIGVMAISPNGFVEAQIGSQVNSLYLKTDGTVWEQAAEQFNAPLVQLQGASDVVQVISSCYNQRQLFLKSDGTLWQIEAGGIYTTPTQVASGVISAGAGLDFIAYLKSDGTLWAQGGDGWAIQFGNGTDPVQVDDHVVSFSSPGWVLLYLKSDGALWGQGDAWNDGLAPGNTYNNPISSTILLDTGVTWVDTNINQILYTTTDGTLWTMGDGFGPGGVPPMAVDSGTTLATGDANETLYLKPDAILRYRTGTPYPSQGPLGPIVDVAQGVVFVNSASDDTGAYVYVQTIGTGTAPTVATQPQSATAQIGTPLTLQVSANGTGPLAYQWSKNGTAVAWAQTAQYTVPFVTATDEGTYFVVVTNSAGQITSATATVSVSALPAITFQPLSQTTSSGGTVTFGVTEYGASSPTYLWQISTNNGATWTNLTDRGVFSGTATASLSITDATGSLSGVQFQCLVGDAAGTIASSPATLTVAVPTSTSISPTSVNSGGGDLTLTVNGSNFNPGDTVLWTDGTPLMTSYLSGNVLTAVVPAADLVTGTDVATELISVQSASGDTSNPEVLSVKSTAVGPIQASVAPAGGSTTDSTAPTVGDTGGITATLQNNATGAVPAAVSVADYSSNPTSVAPAIDVGGQYVDLQVASVAPGDTVTAYFYYPSTVTGTDADNLQLLYFDGTAWSPVLSSGGAVPTKVETPNLDGTVSGGQFTVVFDSTSTPTITALSGTVFTPSIVTVPPVIESVTPSPAYLTPPNNQMVPVSIAVDVSDLFYPNPISRITSVTSNEPPSNGVPEWQITGLLSVNLQAARSSTGTGRIYTITIQTSDSAGNKATQQTEVIVPKDKDALSDPPAIVTQPQSQTVSAGASVTFSVATATALPVTYQWLLNGMNLPGATGTTLTLPSATLAEAGTYTVAATNSVGTTTSHKAKLTVNAPPSFTTEPQSVTASVGTKVTFTAVAVGGPKPKYQWFRNGITISGGKSGTLTINKVKAKDAGTYSVTATNAFGSSTSSPAVLTVTP